MVYCGKPSTGCQACRERKTRCDRNTPSCTQCIRAQRTCPGYRNQLDLMFRNESDAVIGKAKARDNPSSTPRSTPSASPPTPQECHGDFMPDGDYETVQQQMADFNLNTHDPHMRVLSMSIIPTWSLQPTLEQQAQGFFAAHSGAWLRDFSATGSLCPPCVTDEPLLASIRAVGLAGLSHSTRTPDLMIKARKDYVTALRLTNSALRSPTQVKKDSTLFSVMVLGIYETVSGTDAKSIGAWIKHVDGAVALVKLRGQEQFKSTSGQRMFLQIFSSLLVSSIQQNIAVPADMIELREYSAQFFDHSNAAWKMSGIIIDFTRFRAAIRNAEIVAPRDIVARAAEIDQRFINVEKGLRPMFQFRTVYTLEKPDLVWDGYYHVYEHRWAAQIWNGLRVCRILLSESIRDQVLVGSSALLPQFTDDESAAHNSRSAEIMLQMQADILASIPQYFMSAEGKFAPSLEEGSRSYLDLWPLYLVGVMDLSTPSLRAWVVHRLRAMAADIGISQAGVLAEYVANRQEFEEWRTKPVPDRRTMVERVLIHDVGKVLEI
ncbi:hypothetical protein BJ875DRAFT_259104 [Amylocarpus encephaloides]|uniref:Zn(2)-C6 fungal-type domain-containing protein n=1 Tax=Amylocarpus encephaloides TaxID=45428 RepID=A0A9P7Y6N0_9HELO|nr:hypothetical protein BJ875DRAFT_259104 [Amylocarpus encephaloides]